MCVLFRIVEKKALERNAGLFIFHRYMEYCNTYIYIYIAVNTRVCALVGGFTSTNKIVLHRVTASRERFTLLVLCCISIRVGACTSVH